jgi:phosphatidylserine/phosphatidylglycerophosphate/cardiolipin synthase-like enzyme
VNAREQLTEFIRGAKKQLLMYEMKISDRDFVKLLNEKISQGVDVRVIGRTTPKGSSLPTRTPTMRLHARAILRDGRSAFIGSQSLRRLELEARRELGLIVHEPKIVKKMIEVFDKDWREAVAETTPADATNILSVPAKKVARKVAKHLDVGLAVEQALDRVMEKNDDSSLEPKELAESVREAMRDEVQDAVSKALHEMAATAAEASADEPGKGNKQAE